MALRETDHMGNNRKGIGPAEKSQGTLKCSVVLRRPLKGFKRVGFSVGGATAAAAAVTRALSRLDTKECISTLMSSLVDREHHPG